MIQCRHPLQTKSGLVVPCGKCELCYSKRRNDWTIRLCIEAKYSERMPLFVTLTYDDLHLPRVCENHLPTLYRPDVSAFLKEYKRVYGLSNLTFHYFGCGEYGGETVRPHYHLLLFGDVELQRLFDEDVESAQAHIFKVWDKGHVHVCQADFGGIHYVTKYCLKQDDKVLNFDQVVPFTIASKNLGASFFDSKECYMIKRQLDALVLNRDKIYNMVGIVHNDRSYLRHLIDDMSQYFPKFETYLDDGRKVYLPRYFRRKIVGSFEHFKDSPLWVFEHIQKLYDSLCYYETFKDYDKSHKFTAAHEAVLERIDKINRRLRQKKHDKPISRKNEGI